MKQLYHFTALERLVGKYGFAAMGRAQSVDPQDFAEPGSILRAGLKPMAISASAMIYYWLEPCVWLTAHPGRLYSGDRYGWRLTVEIDPGDSRLTSRNDLLRRYKPDLFGNLPAAQDIAGPGGFWVYFGPISPRHFRAVEPSQEVQARVWERPRLGAEVAAE